MTVVLPSLSALGKAAIGYAERGWPVFPLLPGDKVPMKGTHGCKDATTEQRTITRWWRKEPQANIGIATGCRAGLFVVDLDPDKGSAESLCQMEEQFEVLPPTYTVRTGSGGLHLYFRFPDVIPDGLTLSIKAGIYPGVDYRGEDGYVVGAPSVHPTGALYELLVDQELAELPTCYLFLFARRILPLLPIARRREILEAAASTVPGYVEGYAPPEEYFLEAALQWSAPGERDKKAFWLACRLYEHHVPEREAASVLAEYARRCPAGNHPYEKRQALRCVESVYGSSVALGNRSR